MKQKVNSGPTQTGFSNMRSDSWCAATLTTGRCHWTRTAGSCLACLHTSVRGTRDGVVFSVSRRCSQWCPYNYDTRIPPCLVFPLHSRSSAHYLPLFPAFRLCLADAHVNIGRCLHSTCLVCNAAIYMFQTLWFPLVSYVTKLFFNCEIEKAIRGIRHTQRRLIEWLKLLG